MFDIPTTQAIAAFTLALLGGVHCAGMCGGFIGGLQIHRPREVSAARLASGYHLGRITSYALAGVLVGAIGGELYAADVLPIQVALLAAGSLMLLAIGASLFSKGRWLRRLEPLGLALWKLISPWARRVYPPRSTGQALAAGLAWGWIPCGMVYAALPLALVAGGPLNGALVMLAFGLGTLPNLVVVDVVASRVAGRSGGVASAWPWLRVAAGCVIVVFGVSGLAHAARVAGAQHPAIAALAGLCHH